MENRRLSAAIGPYKNVEVGQRKINRVNSFEFLDLNCFKLHAIPRQFISLQCRTTYPHSHAIETSGERRTFTRRRVSPSRYRVFSFERPNLGRLADIVVDCYGCCGEGAFDRQSAHCYLATFAPTKRSMLSTVISEREPTLVLTRSPFRIN